MKSIILITLICLIFQPIFAQSSFSTNNDKGFFSYEFIRPSIDFGGDDGASLFTGAHHFGLHVKMNPRLMFVAELPVANLGLPEEGFRVAETGTKIGNPYVGVQFGNPNRRVFVEFGTRIPVFDREDFSLIHSIAAFADYIDRLEGFAPKVLPFQFFINNRFINRKNGAFFNFRSGGSLIFLVSRENSSFTEDASFHFINGFQAGIDNRQLRFGIIYNSRWLITEDGDFSDLYFHTVGAKVDVKLNYFEPYLSFRKPLNESYSEIASYILTFGIQISASPR
ncbi:MAG: hypothetical protein ACRBF0_25070 [Calditrichia bacterium]